jgi:hypothetical protein
MVGGVVDGAGGVQPRGHQLAAHRVRRQSGGARPHRCQVYHLAHFTLIKK